MLWDVATPAHARHARRPSAGALSVAFSPDGATIATAGADGVIRLWDTATRSPRNSLKYSRCQSVAFSPDGRILASAHQGGDVVLWDAKGGRQLGLLKGHRDQVDQVVFSPDGRSLATAGKDRTVKLWSLATRRQTARATLKRRSHSRQVRRLFPGRQDPGGRRRSADAARHGHALGPGHAEAQGTLDRARARRRHRRLLARRHEPRLGKL